MDGVFIQLAPSIMSLWSSSGKVQSVDAISSKKELGHCGFRSSNGQNASMYLLRLRGPWKCPRNKPQIHRIHRISWSWGGTTTLEAATCTEAKVSPRPLLSRRMLRGPWPSGRKEDQESSGSSLFQGETPFDKGLHHTYLGSFSGGGVLQVIF